MKNLYLLNTPGCDHTAVALGLALNFRERGLKVGFLKPVGCPASSGLDEEAALMHQVMSPDAPDESIMPFMAGPSYLSHRQSLSRLKDRLAQAYQQVAARSDVVVISSPAAPYVATGFQMDVASLATALNAAVLLVVRVENDFSADQAIFYNEYLELKNIPVAGTVFNNAPRSLLAKIQGVYAPLLAERNYRSLGIIPAQPALLAPTVEEIHQVLGGEILAGEENLGLKVEDIVVGAMTIESALSYLRRSPNKAVVTGGDRADLALAALETSTSAVILTGGLYPDVKVVARAQDKGIPLILVHHDTYSAVERLNAISHHIRATDQEAVAWAKNNVSTYCRWQEILDYLDGKGITNPA